jgi:SNF family Na+-dependent transporter
LPGMAAAIGGGVFSVVWLQAATSVVHPVMFVGVKITQ